jgi:ABC-type uncharacterized transport system substrate-binding protein
MPIPVTEGLVPSLARPGGNLTGVTISTGGELLAKRLQYLKELAPTVARVAGQPVIYVQRSRIVAFAAEHRLPTAFNNRESVEEGGLMSYGVKASGLYRRGKQEARAAAWSECAATASVALRIRATTRMRAHNSRRGR